MALIETSLIWVAYAVCIAILFFVSAIFVYTYQKPGERNVAVTMICWITVLSLLATVLLMPVDIALVSSTTSRKLGRKKDWATPDKVDNTLYSLKIVYYTLYSLDAVLCLLVVPFTYFYYEEYDEVAAGEGQQTIANRLWGAFKWTFAFILFCLILFLVGFFVPVTKKARDDHKDLDYFKDLLTENRKSGVLHVSMKMLMASAATDGERALTFAIGVLILVGTILYCLYTAPGLALLPVSLIKTAPSISAPQLRESTQSQLAQNQERQRQLEGRSEGRQEGLDPRDRRELEALVREERTLIRRQRLAEENAGEGQNIFIRVWLKVEAIFRPLKLIFGLLLLVISLILFASMLITMVDKIKNSVCGVSCGYLLGKTKIFQPVNALLRETSKVFPIDYVIFLLIALLFFSATVVGLATIGIRFLWVMLFRIRKGHTTPNAMLMATVLLTLMTLALNYSLAMVVAPQYATFGPQTFCDRPTNKLDLQPDCSQHHQAIKVSTCDERAHHVADTL